MEELPNDQASDLFVFTRISMMQTHCAIDRSSLRAFYYSSLSQ